MFIHKYSGVLSSYGLSKSEIVEERRRYVGVEVVRGGKDAGEVYGGVREKIGGEYGEMEKEIMDGVGRIEEKLANKCYEVGVKYTGTAYTIIVKFTQDFLKNFEEKHMK